MLSMKKIDTIRKYKFDLDMPIRTICYKLDVSPSSVYLEKKSGNDLYSKTGNAGFNNYTKYGFEMHQLYPAVMDYPAL